MTSGQPKNKLRIAIVGCGKIADQHVAAVQRLSDCAIVSVCDREMLMADQLASRFGIQECYADLAECIARSKPDVIHITTPPQSHFTLAKQSLEAGCHVYLEKPFTVTAMEAENIIRLAQGRTLKITAGHNLQFTLEMLRMRELVKRKFLGDRVVHVESHFSYSLDDASYVGPILGNPDHWVRRLPGQLFHNIISHGIAKLAEFLGDDLTEIIAVAQQSERLRKIGGREVLDELRVILRDREGTTALFNFSTQIKPGLNQLQIFGREGSIVVDHASGSLLCNKAHSDKSYLTYFLPPLRSARQNFKNALRNITDFLGRNLYQDAGMKELIDRFYQSVRADGPPPIAYREIVLTARIMDQIFAQIYPAQQREAFISDPPEEGFAVANR